MVDLEGERRSDPRGKSRTSSPAPLPLTTTHKPPSGAQAGGHPARAATRAQGLRAGVSSPSEFACALCRRCLSERRDCRTATRDNRTKQPDAMFHVKHRSPERALVGLPSAATSRPSGSTFSRITNDADPAIRVPAKRSPSIASWSAGHRSGSPPGGSLTRSADRPGTTNGLPHSAVTAGAPKPRATTSGNASRSAGSRPATSARSQIAVDPVLPARGAPPPPRSRPRPAGRESSSTAGAVGHSGARARPGSPPPLPRSRNDSGGGAEHARPGPAVLEMDLQRPRADQPAGPGRPCSTPSSSSPLVHRSGPADHHVPARLLALRAGLHAVDLGHGVVDDLAVGRGHRLEDLVLAGLEHLVHQPPGEGRRARPGASPGSRRRRRGSGRRARRSPAGRPRGRAPRSR